jgi:N-acetylmuramoyl-L-alanine amidase
MVVNSRTEERIGAITESGGAVLLSEEAAAVLRSRLSGRTHDGLRNRITAVVIDPGHGGRDPGTNHRHEVDGRTVEVVEKDVVLKVARDLRTLLARAFPDKQFPLTRDSDVYIALEERVNEANSLDIDPEREAVVFVSIHVNASISNRNSYGYEVWYLPPDYGRRDLVADQEMSIDSVSIRKILNAMKDEEYTLESVLLAKMILEELDAEVGDVSLNRGLKMNDWFVVRNAKMPSVLVELGFATNPEEAVLLNDADHLRRLATALYNGVRRFIEDFERSNGFTE